MLKRRRAAKRDKRTAAVFDQVRVWVRRREALFNDDGSKKLKDWFRAFDTNGNGTLDQKELTAALKAMGVKNLKAAVVESVEDAQISCCSKLCTSNTRAFFPFRSSLGRLISLSFSR